MPLFEYVCPKCGYIFEDFENICPKCKTESEKILSIPNFCIKGSCSNPLPPKNTQTQKECKSRKVFSDWQCKKCKTIIKDEFGDLENTPLCPKCKEHMEQIFDKVNYKLLYNPKSDICDWSGNTSQYWSEVKKQRREGKDVKGFNEI